jgi:beta-glucosidase
MTGAVVGIPGDESALVARLDLKQKVRLLTGRDSWVLHDATEIGLRHLVMSDGPAGVRGTRYDPASPSSSLPCPVALGATWDVALIEELALALGRETRAKGVDVLLGPTVNIIRTPLSGRGFECFSEDALLSALIATAYVRGVQQAGVGATAKHYVANDTETERRTYDARISETVLRELYLPPFEACVAEGVMLIMAAYNSVNGATMTANAPLLKLLKDEWGFDGVVVSDWHAATLTMETALAGLDLVMPGPNGPWGERLVAAVQDGSLSEAVIDEKVRRVLVLARRVGALNAHPDGSSNGAKNGDTAGNTTAQQGHSTILGASDEPGQTAPAAPRRGRQGRPHRPERNRAAAAGWRQHPGPACRTAGPRRSYRRIPRRPRDDQPGLLDRRDHRSSGAWHVSGPGEWARRCALRGDRTSR